MIGFIDLTWRRFGTAISFVLFGVGGVFLALFVFPAVNIIFRSRERRTEVAQRIVHVAWQLFVGTMVTLGVIDFEVDGAEVLRGDTGTLVIANHPSLIDVVLIMSLMDRTQCLVKPGVWDNPFMRGVVAATNYIPNRGDPERVMQECVNALQTGHNLVIFPEGSRTMSGQKSRLQRGFANIALRANAPIRLVAVSCSPPTLRKGEKWYQIPARRPVFRIKVCERLEIEEYLRTEQRSRAARILTAHVSARFEELNANGTT